MALLRVRQRLDAASAQRSRLSWFSKVKYVLIIIDNCSMTEDSLLQLSNLRSSRIGSHKIPTLDYICDNFTQVRKVEWLRVMGYVHLRPTLSIAHSHRHFVLEVGVTVNHSR